MVQQTKTSLQTETNRLFADNTSGDISALDLRTVILDMLDSLEFLAAQPVPSFASFRIDGIPNAVDSGFNLTGSQTFEWTLMNTADVVGTLTITQGATTLSSTIPVASPGSVSLTVTDVTFTAGQAVTFTISGVDKDTNPFSRDYVVTAREADDYVYFGSQVSSDFSSFDFANESRTPIGGATQSFTVPSFSGNEYFGICQPATTADITAIDIDGLNQFDAFTVQRNVFTANSVQYDAWVSDNQLQGSVITGDQVTITR